MAQTLYEAFEGSVEKYGSSIMAGWYNPKKGMYVYSTYDDIKEKVVKLASGLYQIDLELGSKVGLFSKNALECFVVSQACNRMSYINVLFEPSLSWMELEYAIKHSGIDVIFVESSKLETVCKAVRDHDCIVVYFGQATEEELDNISIYCVNALSWKQLMFVGSQQKYGAITPDPEDVCTVIYSKQSVNSFRCSAIKHNQVLESADNFIACAKKSYDTKFASGDCLYAFLPPSNQVQLVCQTALMITGGIIAFWRGEMVRLIDDMCIIKPTVFVAVPRVYERLYEGILRTLSNKHWFTRYLFSFGFYYKLKRLEKGIKCRAASPFFDWLLFNRIKAKLGGEIKLLVSAGDLEDIDVEQFISVSICSNIVKGIDNEYI